MRSAAALVVVAALLANASSSVSPDPPQELAAGDFATAADFAWRTFVALNWPAAPGRGAPDRARALGDPGARVWETFKSAQETFPRDAADRPAPATPSNSFAGRNACGLANWQKTIAAFEPFAEFNQPSFSADAPANPLVARNGEYVRYEVRFNAVQYAAIRDSGWSEGRDLPDVGHPAHFPAGSVAVKAAWRPLNGADAPADRARYYVSRAALVDVAASLSRGRLVCAERDIALVGLHIVVRTPSRPQGVWFSFEHIDNVPPAGVGEPDAREAAAPYGFFDPSAAPRLWPPFGSAGTLAVDREHPPALAARPMQLIRRHPINAALMAVNRDYWARPGVSGTVFAHYMLVAAQWPTSRASPGPGNDGDYFPGKAAAVADDSYKSLAAPQDNLVNTVMESYLQEAPSSCMACHQVVANAKGFDFLGALASRP